MAVRVSILTDFNDRGTKSAIRELDRMKRQAELTGDVVSARMIGASKTLSTVGSKMSKVGTSLTTNVSIPLALVGTAAVNASSNLEEALNKSNVVFGDQADAVSKWSKGSAEGFGMSQRAALEAAGTYGNLFVSMGMGTKQSAEMSTSLVELAGDLASFNNATPEEALEALRSGLTGETEPLKRFGVNLNDATLKAEALRLGLYKGKGVLDANAKAQASYSLILKQTTTAQGDFTRTSSGLANQQRITKAEVEDAAASLGTSLLPIAKDGIIEIRKLADGFNSLSPEMQENIVKFGLIVAAAGPTLKVFGTLSTAAGGLTKSFTETRMASKSLADGSATLGKTMKSSGTDIASTAAASFGLGMALGGLINQIPIVADGQEWLGRKIDEVTASEDQNYVATDYVLKKWKEWGIEVDENNQLTAKGKRQLDELNASKAANNTATTLAAQAQKGWNDELSKTRDLQGGAERADIALQSAKLRLTDAQKAYTDAVKKFGPNSREATDAALALRSANLDLTDAQIRAKDAANQLNTAVASIPKPNSNTRDAWLAYYQAIGDKASYAATKAGAFTFNATHGAQARSSTGGHNIPQYGTGTFATYPHLAMVGDEPEVIIPLGDTAAAAKYLPMLLASLPAPRTASVPSGSYAAGNVNIAPGAINIVLPAGSPAETQRAAGVGVLDALARELMRS